MTNWNQIEKSCESVPFVCAELPDGNVRLWWTKNRGVNGFQVHAFGMSGEKKVFFKTSGYGYCKESEALEAVFVALGIKPKNMRLGGDRLPNAQHIGGNLWCFKPENLEEVA